MVEFAQEPGGSVDPNLGFEQLERRTQIRLLRQLAESALAAYNLPPVRLTLLVHLFNSTFRVDSVTGERFVLRIGRTGAPTIATVSSEVAWLAALRRDTSLQVPDPLYTRDGAPLAVVSIPGVTRPYICVLFRWLQGRQLVRGLTARHMEQVGTVMAQLHNHAVQWKRPPGFERGRVDWPIEEARGLPDPFAPEVAHFIHALVANTLSVAEADGVAAVLERIREAEQTLGSGPDAFGLIHADLHYRNLLFAGRTVRAIDFDDCGFGPRLFDMAVMLSELLDWPQYPALRAALLSGYRKVRLMPAEQEALIDTFIALRRLQDVLWMLNGQKHTAITGDRLARVRESLDPIAALTGENK